MCMKTRSWVILFVAVYSKDQILNIHLFKLPIPGFSDSAFSLQCKFLTRWFSLTFIYVHPEDYMVSFCYVVLFCFERRNILGQLFWHKWWLFIRIGCMMPTSAVSKSHKFSITIIDEVLFGQLWAKDKQEYNSPLIIFK